jgi:phosphosulfolactate synthase (CoM biosynthesis protein A)
LVLLYILTLHAQYVTHQNQTPRNMYYSLVLNNTYMPSELKDTIKQSGKYAN